MFGYGESINYPEDVNLFDDLPTPAETLVEILTRNPIAYNRDALAQLAAANPELLEQVVNGFGIQNEVYRGTAGLYGQELTDKIAANLSRELIGQTAELEVAVTEQ